MLWQFPTNVTGWICYVLVTSSLLKACPEVSGLLRFLILATNCSWSSYEGKCSKHGLQFLKKLLCNNAGGWRWLFLRNFSCRYCCCFCCSHQVYFYMNANLVCLLLQLFCSCSFLNDLLSLQMGVQGWNWSSWPSSYW